MPYTPFYEKFPDIAENEARSLIIQGDSGIKGDRFVLTFALNIGTPHLIFPACGKRSALSLEFTGMRNNL